MERVQKKEEQKQVTGQVMSPIQMARVMGNQAVVQRMDPPGSGFYGKRVSRPPRRFPGMLVGSEASAALDEVLDEEIPEWLNSYRPKYAPGQVMSVWNASNPVRNEDGTETADCVGSESGKVTWTPGTSRLGYWDMGHKFGDEYWRSLKQLRDGEIRFNEFLFVFQDPENYQVEDPVHNRRHTGERR